jgi:hypothetical protein
MYGPAPAHSSQYLGGVAGAAGAAALHDDLPPLAGAADPAGAAPPPLHELLPPAAGVFGSGVAVFPPPHATVEPTSIPATADTARAFAMFITFVSPLLLEERPGFSFGSGEAAGLGKSWRGQSSHVSSESRRLFCRVGDRPTERRSLGVRFVGQRGRWTRAR